MRTAVRNIARGKKATLRGELAVHMVASAYGQSPEAVREWPAEDYLNALEFLPAVRTVSIPGGDE